MSATKAAPATHSQPSRKGKRAWRKNVDLTEVQSGLEEARDEVIHGGIIAEKPSDELFVLDTTGSEQIKKKHLKQSKPLRADQIIAERNSAIPAVDSRKRKSLEIAPSDKSKRSKKNTYISEAEVQRLRSALDLKAGNGVVAHAPTADHDPWAVVPKVQDPRFNFLEEKAPVHEPDTLKQAPISLAASGKPFAAVRRPDAGKSYNPDFDAWQTALTRAGEKEVEAERKRRAAAAAEEEATARALAEAARPEASESEYESAWESEWEGLRSEAEDGGAPAKRPERKTPAERNKIKRRKERESQARHEVRSRLREERHRLAKENHAGGHRLAPAIRPDESSDESDEEEVLRRRPLGKNYVPEPNLEVVLADELQDSLRALRPEGNLLKDRYRNLLINGKLEVRKGNIQHRKPKREVTEKWSYKDWTLRP